MSDPVIDLPTLDNSDVVDFTEKTHVKVPAPVDPDDAARKSDTTLPSRLGVTAALLVSESDLNLAVYTGWYRGYNLVHAPIASTWCYVEVIAHSPGYVVQVAYSYFAEHAHWIRWLENGTWSIWYKQASESYARTVGVSTATASTVVRRDSAGRTQVNDPAVAADVDTKGARDAAILAATRGQIPSSVTIGSGSASVSADGTVTFTGVKSLSLNGVFDGLGADVYEVYLQLVGTSATAVQTRVRSAGVDVASAAYNYAYMFATLGSGPSRGSLTSTTFFGSWVPTAGGTDRIVRGRMTLMQPMKVMETWMMLDCWVAVAGDRYNWVEKGEMSGSTKCDGMSIILSAGTMTGTIKVVKVG